MINNISFLLSKIWITPSIGASGHSVVTVEFDMRIKNDIASDEKRDIISAAIMATLEEK